MPTTSLCSAAAILKRAIVLTIAPALIAFMPSCTNHIADETAPADEIWPGGNRSIKSNGSSLPSTLQAGEVVDVFVIEDESFSGKYEVRSGGDIIVPKIGRVKVGGLSAPGAEKVLKAALQKDQLTKATVILERSTVSPIAEQAETELAVEVFLSGKVSQPGRYTVVGVNGSPPTVNQAILQSGGCTRFAYKKKVHILRPTASGRLRKVPTNLLAIEDGEIPDVPLLPGDTVVVPEKKVDLGL